MRFKFVSIIITGLMLLALLIGASGVLAQTAQPPQSPTGGGGPGNADNTFSYQGQLKFNGVPYDGICDFQFNLYDAATAGNNKGMTSVPNLAVSRGLFTTWLNYSFTGQRIWLEIAVRCPASSGAYTTLSPRQLITAAPYAMSLLPGSETYYMNGNSLTSYMRAPNSYVGVEGRVNDGKYGVRGASNNFGTSLGKYGVLGTASEGLVSDINPDFYDAGGAFVGPNGVIGVASNESNYGYGVIGQTASSNGRGVYGVVMTSTGQNQGVFGWSQSNSGTGVYGAKVNSSGITPYGPNPSSWTYAPGVWGDTNTGDGVWGTSSATNGYGVSGAASGDGGVGVYGMTTIANAWAGKFAGFNSGNGVYISAPEGSVGLNVAGGTKNAVVRTNQGSRLLYTEESSEVWFTDYGFGKLKNGVAVIPIDPLFAQTVVLTESYHVFVQSYGDADLYVSQRTPAQFEVKARGTSDPSVEFSYRLVAKRLGYETDRLAPAPWADNDPNLYPEKQNQPQSANKSARTGTSGSLPMPDQGQGH